MPPNYPKRSLWDIFQAASRTQEISKHMSQLVQQYRIPPWSDCKTRDIKPIPDSIQEIAALIANSPTEETESHFEKQFANFIYSSNAIESAGLEQSGTCKIVLEILNGLKTEGSDIFTTIKSKLRLDFDQPKEQPYREVIQHVEAFIYLIDEISKSDTLTEETLLQCHHILTTGILSDQGYDNYQGSYRRCEMTVGNPLRLREGGEKKVADADEVEEKMSAWIEKYNTALGKTSDAIATGSYFKIRFLDIHPFLDGNGRMSRLLFNALIARYYPHTIVNFGETAKGRRKYMSSVRESLRRGAPGIFAFQALKQAASSTIQRLEGLKASQIEMTPTRKESIDALKKICDGYAETQ
ncbi:hypothetical protein AA313_de0202126 [Arthrobotrys entomopaga]|nr:hypothetical protein AA313_de0202126 [Arthrobotrys entomopaga]